MTPSIWLLAFASMTVLDLAWVGYNRATAQGRTVAACLWAAVLAGLSGVNTLAILADPLYLSATVCGAVVGTGAGLRLSQWLERKKDER